MKFWDNIKFYFYKKKIAQQLNASTTQRVLTNLSDANSVGIIYDSSNAANDIVISKFSDSLRQQGKSVDVLTFVNDTKTNDKVGIMLFNKKNINWISVPDGEMVEKFAAKKFDLLFACFTGENLPLEYIAAVSKAKWRVGVYSPIKTDYYDLMVKTEGQQDVSYFLQQATIFLNRINYDSK